MDWCSLGVEGWTVEVWTVKVWTMIAPRVGGQVTGQLQACHRGDQHVVNCLEQHPHLPLVIATSGVRSGHTGGSDRRH